MGQEEILAISDRMPAELGGGITITDPLGWRTALNLAGKAITAGCVDELPVLLQMLGLIPTPTGEVFDCGHPKTAANTHYRESGNTGCLRCRSGRVA